MESSNTCPNGHFLGIPENFRGYTCDICRKKDHRSSAGLYCERCDFDVCPACKENLDNIRECSKPSVFNKTSTNDEKNATLIAGTKGERVLECPNGHALLPPGTCGKKFHCDICKQRGLFRNLESLYCEICDFDVCSGCRQQVYSACSGVENVNMAEWVDGLKGNVFFETGEDEKDAKVISQMPYLHTTISEWKKKLHQLETQNQRQTKQLVKLQAELLKEKDTSINLEILNKQSKAKIIELECAQTMTVSSEKDEDVVEGIARLMNKTPLNQTGLKKLSDLEKMFQSYLQEITLAKEDIKEREELCCICMELKKTVVFLPCKHMCACANCAYSHSLEKCPICCCEITERLVIFS